MRIIRCVKYKLRKLLGIIMKYDNDIYYNYLRFYDILFDYKIKNVKQMKKILIKIIEYSYNIRLKNTEPQMMIYHRARHDVEVYWTEYFMRNILELKDIYDKPRELCREYKKRK